MGILGSQIDEITAIRKDLGSKTITINSDVRIERVSKKTAVIADRKETMLEFGFAFDLIYNKESKILIKGTIFYTDEDKKLDSIEKDWNKNKKINTEEIIPILNHAMEIGYKNSFYVTDKLRLPTPIRLPKFVQEEEKKKKK